MQTLYRSVSDVTIESPVAVPSTVLCDEKVDGAGALTLRSLIDVVLACVRSARAGFGD